MQNEFLENADGTAGRETDAGILERPPPRSDDLGFPQAISSYSPRIVGQQQVTDAYLLGLAIHKKGKLATLDRALATVLPESSFAREALLLI